LIARKYRIVSYDILAEIVPSTRNKIWQKTRIDVKPVLSRSEWLHKFLSTLSYFILYRTTVMVNQDEYTIRHAASAGMADDKFIISILQRKHHMTACGL